MFKFGYGFEAEDGVSFEGHTLYFPAAAVGNVGQLATDLLLVNLNGGTKPVKIGRIFHPALEAVVGLEIHQVGDSPPDLMTSCEIFHVKEAKYVIIHFHAPVSMKRRQEFVDFFMNWIKEQKFAQVVCFSSVFASDRIDPQLVGIPFRYLSTDSTPVELINKLTEQDWKPLEKREFPAPAVLNSDTTDNSNESGVIHLPGSGITKNVYESCQSQGIPFLALIMFASEGDNTPEAMTLFQMADKLFGFRLSPENIPDNSRDSPPLVVPISWTHFREESHSSLIY